MTLRGDRALKERVTSTLGTRYTHPREAGGVMSGPRGCLGVTWGRGGARRGAAGSLGERAVSLLQAPVGGSAAFSLQEGKPKYPVP